MKIVVMSDTHSRILPKALIDELKTADMVVHAGDFEDIDVLDELRKKYTVKAVYGNMDGPDLRKALPRSDVFSCEGVNIGLFHGEGPGRGLLERVRAQFFDRNVRVVIFGHSHEAMNQDVDGVLYFNPGSPTDDICAPYRSFGVLLIDGEKVKGHIVKIKQA